MNELKNMLNDTIGLVVQMNKPKMPLIQRLFINLFVVCLLIVLTPITMVLWVCLFTLRKLFSREDKTILISPTLRIEHKQHKEDIL